MDIKIVVCGGHFTPAWAVIEEMKNNKNYRIVYIGKKNPFEGDKSLSLEYQTIVKFKIPFVSLYCGRLQRFLSWYTIPSFIKLPIAILQSLIILLKVKPNIILSFGGYIALPVCFAGWILNIPIITHEQTHVLGLTNRLISRFAKLTCLSWEKTDFVPSGIKTSVTGIPIRKEILFPKITRIVNFGDKKLPIIYITGGSLGSHSLNFIMGNIISELIHDFRIIHQCGSYKGGKDKDFLLDIKKSLPLNLRDNYCIFNHLSSKDVGTILNQAKLIIGRAGANTVSEIAAVGIPAVFIPLPWAADNEQYKNAHMLEILGGAIIIMQDQLNTKLFTSSIRQITDNYHIYSQNAKKAKIFFSQTAAKKIIELIEIHRKI